MSGEENVLNDTLICSHEIFFFLSGFSFMGTGSQDSRRREGTIFYSSLPFPPVHEHSDNYLQLCMWDRIFLIAPLVFYQTATWWDLPPYPITIWLIDDVMLISFLYFDCLFTYLFLLHNLTRETGGLELASPCITSEP